MRDLERVVILLSVLSVGLSASAAALSAKKVVMRYQMPAYEMMDAEVPEVDTTNVFYFSDSRIRIEQPSMIQIYDLESDSWYTIYPEHEIFTEGKPGAQTRQALQGGGMFAGLDAISSSVAHEATDDTATIDGYLCTRHILRIDTPMIKSTSEVWVTDEIDVNPELSKAIFGAGSIGQSLAEAYEEAVGEMSGFMVKSSVTASMLPDMTVLTTVESIEEVEVPEDYFEIPEDYELYPAPSDENSSNGK